MSVVKYADNDDHNNTDLLLVNDTVRFFTKNQEGEDNFFTEQNIFYKLQRVSENGVDFNYVETGIGELYKKGKNFLFKREWCFDFNDSNSVGRRKIPKNGNIPKTKVSEKEKLFLSKYTPENFRKTLVSKNSVMCSTDRFTPCPVELQNSTLLGRLNNQIQSINKSELRKILTDEEMIQAISYNKKTFDFHTRNINILNKKGRLSTPYLHLKFNEEIRPKKGYLRYNYEDDCFEGYDGKRWRALIWEGNDEDSK
jgi:hypothetical protein